jgi:ribose transport system ATP-binding protein
MKGDTVTGRSALLEMRGISKAFGRNVVLRDVDLRLQGGEVHGLVGMNGSGKSTLIKILAGIHQCEPGGTIVYGDARQGGDARTQSARPRRLGLSMTSAQEHPGVGFVHQDLGIVPELSLIDNFALTFGYETRRGTVSTDRVRAKVVSGLQGVGVDADPDSQASELGAADRSLFAIARALEQLDRADSPVLVLDEPTAALPLRESQRVAKVVRDLAERGAAVLLVTHHLAEVMQITDRVTVLRDGEVVLASPTADVTQEAVIDAMLGEKVERVLQRQHREHSAAHAGEAASVVAVDGLNASRVRDVAFTASAGEILVLTGLVGCGKSQVGRVLAGADTAYEGTLRLGGAPYRPANPRQAIEAGVSYVPAERIERGGILAFTARENISLAVLGDYGRRGVVDRRPENEMARRWLGATQVRPADPDLPFASFSGGNQQKIVLSRALATKPRVLVVDEPTQGVDVGAIPVIYQQLRDAAAQGTAVIVITSSYEETVEIADRAVVMDRGHVVAELPASRLSVGALLQVPAAVTAIKPTTAEGVLDV